MFELGRSLHEARVRRGFELGQVAAETRIRTRYLRALEEARFELIPGSVYAKGFLRAYADHLGLDSQLFLDEYNARFSVEETVPAPPQLQLRPRPLRSYVAAAAEGTSRQRRPRSPRHSRALLVVGLPAKQCRQAPLRGNTRAGQLAALWPRASLDTHRRALEPGRKSWRTPAFAPTDGRNGARNRKWHANGRAQIATTSSPIGATGCCRY
jgi:hypothetical protein